MRRPVTTASIARSTDMPLPGHYDVITLQLNYTRYQAAATSKAILVLREPVGGIELDRWVLDLAPDSDQSDAELVEGLLEAITKTLYLQSGMNSRGSATHPS